MNKMVKLLLACTGILLFPAAGAAPKEHTLRNDKLQVSIDDRGRLTSIRNLETGRDYAGGDYLWRLYYDTQKAKEIEVLPGEQTPRISRRGDTLTLT